MGLSVWMIWMKAGGSMRILVFLLIESLSPWIVTLMAATVLVRTVGTCNDREHREDQGFLKGNLNVQEERTAKCSFVPNNILCPVEKCFSRFSFFVVLTGESYFHHCDHARQTQCKRLFEKHWIRNILFTRTHVFRPPSNRSNVWCWTLAKQMKPQLTVARNTRK